MEFGGGGTFCRAALSVTHPHVWGAIRNKTRNSLTYFQPVHDQTRVRHSQGARWRNYRWRIRLDAQNAMLGTLGGCRLPIPAISLESRGSGRSPPWLIQASRPANQPPVAPKPNVLISNTNGSATPHQSFSSKRQQKNGEVQASLLMQGPHSSRESATRQRLRHQLSSAAGREGGARRSGRHAEPGC